MKLLTLSQISQLLKDEGIDHFEFWLVARQGGMLPMPKRAVLQVIEQIREHFEKLATSLPVLEFVCKIQRDDGDEALRVIVEQGWKNDVPPEIDDRMVSLVEVSDAVRPNFRAQMGRSAIRYAAYYLLYLSKK